MISKIEFYEDLLQQIYSDSISKDELKFESFFNYICEILNDEGELSDNYEMAHFQREIKGKGFIEIFGYDYDEERESLSLITQKFYETTEIENILKKDIETLLTKTSRFLNLIKNNIYKSLEETSPEYSMAYDIYEKLVNKKISNIKIILLTNGLNKSIKKIDLKTEFLGIKLQYRVVDLEYLYKVCVSKNQETSFSINTNFSFLEADKTSNYSSYLLIINGEDLFEVYNKYGQKLLEHNVRTFLQFRGNVNKGIKNTIRRHPEKFFAYNNGITATASTVEIKNNKIVRINDLQIVNGGQTISAIYSSKKKDKLDISEVYVQVKLSVVEKKEDYDDFVSKVSEYANTQNKVNKSDFASNNPYQKNIKKQSLRIWGPVLNGSQYKTKWFFERVRGEYLNEQSYLTLSEKRSFKIENPKQQVFDKLLLAKSENSWNCHPNIVAKGSQANFAHFMKNYKNEVDDDLEITEKEYKEIISRIIIFKNLEKSISKSIWYKNGYRAQTVTYTLAWFSNYLLENKYYLNFNRIWDNQELPSVLSNTLKNIAKYVYECINKPITTSNISEWCKKIECWSYVKRLNIEIDLPKSFFIDYEEHKEIVRENKKDKKLENGIDVQTFVAVNLYSNIWDEMYKEFKNSYFDYKLTESQLEILRNFVSKKNRGCPNLFTSQKLYDLYDLAVNNNVIDRIQDNI